MTTLYHATTLATWAPHVGACLTADRKAAIESAELHAWRPGGRATIYVHAIEIADSLTSDDRTESVDRDGNDYPGDTAESLASLAAEGLDVVTYDDETATGRTMECTRIISATAVAACTVISTTTVED